MEISSFYRDVCSKYCPDQELIKSSWIELQSRYSEKHRFYHTLDHLRHLYTQFECCKAFLKSTDSVAFALFYHDIIYRPWSNKNEKLSAVFCEARLKLMEVPATLIEETKELILITSEHQADYCGDQEYFIDMDLSILGSPPEIYHGYTENIRKENAFMPGWLYSRRRKSFLETMLKRSSVYHTDTFQNKLEKQAQLNLSMELLSL